MNILFLTQMLMSVCCVSHTGLTAVVCVKVPEPEFEGQTKTRLGNPEVCTCTCVTVHLATLTFFICLLSVGFHWISHNNFLLSSYRLIKYCYVFLPHSLIVLIPPLVCHSWLTLCHYHRRNIDLKHFSQLFRCLFLRLLFFFSCVLLGPSDRGQCGVRLPNHSIRMEPTGKIDVMYKLRRGVDCSQ